MGMPQVLYAVIATIIRSAKVHPALLGILTCTQLNICSVFVIQIAELFMTESNNMFRLQLK